MRTPLEASLSSRILYFKLLKVKGSRLKEISKGVSSSIVKEVLPKISETILVN